MKKLFRSKAVTGILFLLAVALLTTGSIGGTRAALNIYSEYYESELSMRDIGVSLTEEGGIVANRDYAAYSDGIWKGNANGFVMNQKDKSGIFGADLECLVKRSGDDSFKIGKSYPLTLGVSNTGAIDEYVRVTIYRYWVDPPATDEEHGWFDGSGTKRRDLDPELIELYMNGQKIDQTAPAGWTLDTSAPSEGHERIVLYYNSILPVGVLPSLWILSVSTEVSSNMSAP